MKKYITFDWVACRCSGGETVAEELYNDRVELLKKVFGAFKFTITNITEA